MTEPLAASFQIETLLTITEAAQVAPPALPRRFVIRGDEELAEFGYESRTSPRNETATINYKCTPAIFRFYPYSHPTKEDLGDFRVNISPLLPAYLALNGENDTDDPKTRYLFNPGTALFNDKGYPMQMYGTMSGNELRGERVGDWFRMETLKPGSNVAGMTHATHPHFVHKFYLVCWDSERERTYHKPVKYGWDIFYYLVSNEGYGYIPHRYVKEI